MSSATKVIRHRPRPRELSESDIRLIFPFSVPDAVCCNFLHRYTSAKKMRVLVDSVVKSPPSKSRRCVFPQGENND
jgi:hypothetical protein